MRRPAVSVLVPVRHAESTVASALRSIARQRFVDWECVIVADGSNAATLAAISATVAGDDRFKVYQRPAQGIVNALNYGIEQCRGAFIARMDADDVMLRERLGVQHERLCSRPDLAAIGTHVRNWPRRPDTDGRRRYERWLNSLNDECDIARDMFIECPLAHPSLMIRAALLRSFRYQNHNWAEDYDLMLRLHGSGHKLGVIPKPMLAWRDEPSRLSRTDPRLSPERFAACKAMYLSKTILAGRNGYILWGHGPTGRQLKRALSALGIAPRLIVDVHPRRIGERIDGVDVIAPEQLTYDGEQRLLAAVSGDAARTEIRDALNAKGFLEGSDFVCVA